MKPNSNLGRNNVVNKIEIGDPQGSQPGQGNCMGYLHKTNPRPKSKPKIVEE